MKKVVKFLIIKIMNGFGYSDLFGLRLVREVFDILLFDHAFTFKQKLWALRRGFFPSRVKMYDLNQDNYKLYLSDFAYYRMHPINNRFRFWVNDKLTYRYVLGKYDEFLPRYYCHMLGQGIYLSLDPDVRLSNAEDILGFLKIRKSLALKKCVGSSGKGFTRIDYISGDFYVNGVRCDHEQMIPILNDFKDYIMMEYVIGHNDTQKYREEALSTVRIFTLNTPQTGIKIFSAYLRLGTSETGFIDNINAGGVFSFVNIENGTYDTAYRHLDHVTTPCPYHPDSNLKIEGVVPNWVLIKEKITEMSQYMNELTYLGWDIAMTEDGFKILEINTHPAISTIQSLYPILDSDVAPFFVERFKKRMKPE